MSAYFYSLCLLFYTLTNYNLRHKKSFVSGDDECINSRYALRHFMATKQLTETGSGRRYTTLLLLLHHCCSGQYMYIEDIRSVEWSASRMVMVWRMSGESLMNTRLVAQSADPVTS